MNRITADHLARRACVYIRQSTPDQVKYNLESKRRQHSPYAKGNFQFERVVTGWRASSPVLDLRLKR